MRRGENPLVALCCHREAENSNHTLPFHKKHHNSAVKRTDGDCLTINDFGERVTQTHGYFYCPGNHFWIIVTQRRQRHWAKFINDVESSSMSAGTDCIYGKRTGLVYNFFKFYRPHKALNSIKHIHTFTQHYYMLLFVYHTLVIWDNLDLAQGHFRMYTGNQGLNLGPFWLVHKSQSHHDM